jgi:hypothetical protein
MVCRRRLCYAGACASYVRDMRVFHEGVRELAKSVGAHDDAAANRRHLQRLGLALLDMTIAACRLMDHLVHTSEKSTSQRATG